MFESELDEDVNRKSSIVQQESVDRKSSIVRQQSTMFNNSA